MSTTERPKIPYAGKEHLQRDLDAGRAARASAAFTHDGAILGLWKLGLDTFEIAKRLGVRESQIANRIARLRDAGAVRLLEHVRSERRWEARWQDFIQPAWTRITGGCHPNRDTEAAVRRAGFQIDERRVNRNLRRLVARKTE